MDKEKNDVEETLKRFLSAFENCDLARMEQMFDPECVSFPQVVAGRPREPDLDLTGYRRSQGMPRDMRRLAHELPKKVPGPPYLSLVPNDLLIQIFGSTAVATFHFDHEGSLGRRSIVFVNRGGDWKIVHVHPSGIQTGV